MSDAPSPAPSGSPPRPATGCRPGTGAGARPGDRTAADGRPRVRRRTLLLGGAAVAGLGAAGAAWAAREELERLWWRMPGVALPRREGEVDHPGAHWVAASEANFRRADRPRDYLVDRVVIHVVQGGYDSALRAFRDPEHRAATHYVVREDGRIAQTVRELDVAFHAGNRAYNERSVGIEHAGWVDRPESFTMAMYRASAGLTAAICARYGMEPDRAHVIGHIEVPGADHTDPGPHWDWDRYLRMVRAAGRGR
ncbi:N-acetylmuramoyl-L-alanine amidase [Streptomyces pactum]|uniref:N-acetylmuramoyl-L-alanine amidase n=1 Tax=Streptomyces pactum TaxID=68249 RepID=A0ABS0NPW3_9ACTN|nr:peptidoglycan recognition family protein [Streptomyces pactum]MBH5337127.1 N-acetylmuramoyl-L-alanine amidase [Streptomyces pactum]